MIPIVSDRSCGTCTMCCQGHLVGKAHGFEFGPGKPCYYITKKGCQIYDYRPKDPCKTFNCEWKRDRDYPEELRPDKSNVIFVARVDEEGKSYIDVVTSIHVCSHKDHLEAEELSVEMFHFIIKLFNSNKYDYIKYPYKNEYHKLSK